MWKSASAAKYRFGSLGSCIDRARTVAVAKSVEPLIKRLTQLEELTKGFKGVDWEAAYQAIRNTLREKHPGRHKEDSYAGRPDLAASRICRH